MKKYILFFALSLSGLATANAVEGDAIAGKNKSAMCAACHSADGNSVVSIYPKLAGQNANYIEKQLHDFKKGLTSGGTAGRVDPVMGGMAMALSDQDIADLAAFFSEQKSTEGNGEENTLGKTLYLGGDNERGITACIACHGVQGKGMEQAGFPSIANQNTDYLKTQLMNFRDAKRKNDSNAMMRNIAIQLEDTEIEALANYISSIK